jgi:type I restriction enzyme S subunit
MKPYSKYKDSGIEWIGEIPKHWKSSKVKYLGSAIGGVTYSPNNIVENNSLGKLVLRSSNIQKGELYLNDNVYINSEISNKKLLQKGDILICSRNGSKRLIGKNICIDERTEGETFGAFMMIFRSENYKFMKWYFKSPIFHSQSGLFLTSTINQLTSTTLNNFFISFPESSEEQTQIANYLDKKTAQIDSLIAKKESLIQLLEEEKTALINQAVTKGLDLNVKMKDSGIEWLGEIPEHWEVWKISHAFKEIGSGTTPESGNPKYHKNGTINWLNTGDLNNDVLFDSAKKITDKAMKDYTSLKKFPKGSLVIAMYGATIGKTAIIDFETTTNQACCVFGKSEIILIDFLHYWFKANKEHIINLSIGGGQPNISQQILKGIRLGNPDLQEQNKICNFLDAEIEKKKLIANKARKEIELLKEYRTTLISEVVTGKVDVRVKVID